MWRAGIFEDRHVGPPREPVDVKVTADSYCNILKAVLNPWLDDIPP